MSPDRWRRIQALFDTVADLPRAERASAISREASGDEDLRREVEALLHAEGEATHFFENLGGALDRSGRQRPNRQRPGRDGSSRREAAT